MNSSAPTGVLLQGAGRARQSGRRAHGVGDRQQIGGRSANSFTQFASDLAQCARCTLAQTWLRQGSDGAATWFR